jgi:hypothetical protein
VAGEERGSPEREANAAARLRVAEEEVEVLVVDSSRLGEVLGNQAEEGEVARRFLQLDGLGEVHSIVYVALREVVMAARCGRKKVRWRRKTAAERRGLGFGGAQTRLK